jgi:hypothetical protein
LYGPAEVATIGHIIEAGRVRQHKIFVSVHFYTGIRRKKRVVALSISQATTHPTSDSSEIERARYLSLFYPYCILSTPTPTIRAIGVGTNTLPDLPCNTTITVSFYLWRCIFLDHSARTASSLQCSLRRRHRDLTSKQFV